MHSISAVGGRGRRIDVDEVESTQRLNRRPRECVASDSGTFCLQMRFQPPRTLTVEAVFIVIQYGVEGRWTHMVVSAVDMLLYRCRDEVSPLQPTFAPRGVSCGHGLHS